MRSSSDESKGETRWHAGNRAPQHPARHDQHNPNHHNDGDNRELPTFEAVQQLQQACNRIYITIWDRNTRIPNELWMPSTKQSHQVRVAVGTTP